ncbi:hypothetical protein T03_3119, partial [Trichinella britovi]
PSGKRETERKGNAPVNTSPSTNSDGRGIRISWIWLSGLDGDEQEMDTEIDSAIINTGVSRSTLMKQEVKCCWAESSETSESISTRKLEVLLQHSRFFKQIIQYSDITPR